MHLDKNFVSNVIDQAIIEGNQKFPEDFQVNIDSRKIQKGEIFAAIKGNRADGHDFIVDAVSKGAIGLIINLNNRDCLKKLDKEIVKKILVICVPDTQEAIIKLASAHRSKFTCPIIGITGSIGKTSTKEMLCNIIKLSKKNKFIYSIGNQNTALGISLNILRMKPEHELAIFELGISRRGEMARMAQLVRPTMAIITQIGHSHMEGLGSLVDIANEKRDIFKYFKEDNIGIINGDQAILSNISYTHPIVKFGCKTTNQIQARKIQPNNSTTHFVLKLYKEKYKIILDTNNTARVINALASASAARLLGISDQDIINGISTPINISGRFETTNLKKSKGILINDCYNANPESMKAALLAFEKLESKGQKIAVLGDMLELGVNSPFWHRQLGRFLRKVPSLSHVVLVGDLVKWTKSTLPVGLTHEHVANWKEATTSLLKKLDKESVILVKGSLGMSLSNLVTELT